MDEKTRRMEIIPRLLQDEELVHQPARWEQDHAGLEVGVVSRADV